MEEAASLGTPDRSGVPIAAWEESLPILFHGMHQYHITGRQEPDSEYPVAVQRLDTFGKGAIHEASALVEVTSKAVYDAPLEDEFHVTL